MPRVHSRPAPLRLGLPEELLLRGLARYLFLTADRLTARSYSAKSLRYVQKRLAALAEAGLVERAPGYARSGKPPLVYSLSTKGWRYAEASFGVARPPRWRPSEHAHGFTQYLHDLAIADFGIAVEQLARAGYPHIQLVRFIHDRFLPQTRVQLASGARQGIRLDAFVELRLLRGEPPRPKQRCLALELDRSSHYQQAIRRKIEAQLAYVEGGDYQREFDTTSLTYVWVCPGDPQRVTQLLTYTEAVLQERGAVEVAPLFAFTSADPALTDPVDLFLRAPRWFVPFRRDPTALLAGGTQERTLRLDRTSYLPREDYVRFLTAIGEPIPEIAAERDTA